MTSKEIKAYYDTGKIDELYKINKKYFDLIDSWADKMIEGDILNELELAQAMEQINACQTKLNPIAGCLEAMAEEYEYNYQIQEESKLTALRVQDQNSCKAKARSKSGDLKRYASDFQRYSYSAQNTVTVAQSRLKRLVVEGGNKGIYRTGETSIATPIIIPEQNSGTPVIKDLPSTSSNDVNWIE